MESTDIRLEGPEGWWATIIEALEYTAAGERVDDDLPVDEAVICLAGVSLVGAGLPADEVVAMFRDHECVITIAFDPSESELLARVEWPGGDFEPVAVVATLIQELEEELEPPND